ncbi:MAG: GNAT family N-acetyltransferase, partial [Proteobacteria bacterium]|nr:GNAT family N-acetyltransferase [Pseudomonadota bacterium]
MTVKIERYHSRYFDGVKALWAEVNPSEPPWNAAEIAIPLKLGHQPELFLVATENDVVIGTTIAGFDGHRGWVHAVAVKPSHR